MENNLVKLKNKNMEENSRFNLKDVSYTNINLIFVLIINFLVAIITKLFFTNSGEDNAFLMLLFLIAALFVHFVIMLIAAIESLVTGKFSEAKDIFLSIILVLLVGVPYCIILSSIFN